MELTTEQQRFILRYINNRGDFYKTVASLGLELSHIVSWQHQNFKFDKTFKEAKQSVIESLKQENHMIALLKVNDALINGITHQSIQQKHLIGGEDKSESVYEVIRITKNMGVPAWAVKQALSEYGIVRAVDLLAAEGILPNDVARKISQAANRITSEIKNSFESTPDSDFINDSKVIELIKAAVLGNVEI